jgi:hypothetical protein
MRQSFLTLVVAITVFCSAGLSAQTITPKSAAHRYCAEHEQQILQEFTSLLAIPNVASDKANIRRNADTLVRALEKRHVAAKLLDAPGANPVVYGEIKTPGAKHTIVFYAHYDGQPVTPEDWETKAPFTPVTKVVNGEPRIYARSASDDKAAIIAQLTALDALQAANLHPKANLRFVWEGEEEAGSTNLGAVLAKYRDGWAVTSGSSATARSIRAAARRSSSAPAVSRIWRLRSTAQIEGYTADTTATGRPTQP